MKVITIRNVEPAVSEILKSEVKKPGKSVNQFIIDMIEQNLRLKKGRNILISTVILTISSENEQTRNRKLFQKMEHYVLTFYQKQSK